MAVWFQGGNGMIKGPGNGKLLNSCSQETKKKGRSRVRNTSSKGMPLVIHFLEVSLTFCNSTFSYDPSNELIH